MTNDDLINRLAGDLTPVRARTPGHDAMTIGSIALIELVLFLALGGMRPDMPDAMEHPGFWWKLVSLALIALTSCVVAILSLDPSRSPRRGLRLVLALILLCVAAGWLVDAAGEGWPALWARLDWRDGLSCVTKMVLLSIPPVLGLGTLMRRGAPTDRSGTAWIAGLAAAAWGAFVFVFACPFDDPLYIAVWYLVGCGLVSVAARLLLPLTSRW
jgi:hypothetical protein